MENNVIPEADENYVWVIHTKSRSAIYALQQTNDTLVTFLPDLRGRPMATLLGRPILWTDKVPYLSGDVSTRVSLIDPGMIVCAEYQGIAIAVSDQVRFEDDETVFRAILSMDAQPWLTSKVEIASGEYVSGFITI
jgi:HK97 family phage major capsid protein